MSLGEKERMLTMTFHERPSIMKYAHHNMAIGYDGTL